MGFNFWAAVSRNGLGRLVFYQGRINKFKYLEIIQNNVKETAEELGVHYGLIVLRIRQLSSNL